MFVNEIKNEISGVLVLQFLFRDASLGEKLFQLGINIFYVEAFVNANVEEADVFFPYLAWRMMTDGALF